MSNITLDQIIAAATNMGGTPAEQGKNIAMIVKTIDDANKLAASRNARKATAQTTPKAPAKGRKSADKAASTHLVRTLNGGMMDSRPGTVTNGQIDKLISLCDKLGEPLTKDEVAIICGYSMAQASDYRYQILQDSK